MNESSDLRVAELQQLQREYRHMELNRRAYAEESQLVLRKQQATIDKLRKDNEMIKGELAIMMRTTNKNISPSQQEIISKLQDQGDRLATTVEFEKRNIKTLEEQIHVMKQKVLQQRKAMGGVNASKENYQMIQKQIRILENRLDKSLVKFNEAIAHNKKLRDSIDDLRRERVVFENIYRKMEKELQDKKQKMAEIIEVSNQSYEQRDSYQMEVAAIEQANRKEQEEFEEQIVELGRMLETELKLPSNSRPGTNTGTMFTATLPKSSEEDMKKSGTWNQNAEKKDVLASYERVQNFEEAFNKIKAATGITDIDELVKTFIKNEDHNFSLFNYVNEQNNEIEKLDEQIQNLREEERKFAHESGEDVHQHKQILKELEAKLQNSESMAEKYEIRCQDLQRIIESLKRGIQSIYDKIEVEDDSFADPTVTESNMVYYLGIVEQHANKILKSYAEVRQALLNPTQTQSPSAPSDEYKEKEDDKDKLPAISNVPISPGKASTLTSVLGVGPKVPMGQELLHVNPPKLDDYQSDDEEEEDDDDTRPLTRDELKARTLNRLQKKGHQGGAKGKAKGNAKKMAATR